MASNGYNNSVMSTGATDDGLMHRHKGENMVSWRCRRAWALDLRPG